MNNVKSAIRQLAMRPGLAAGYLPARHASNVDPLVALRYE